MNRRDDEHPFRPRPGRSRREAAPDSFIRNVRKLAAQAPGATTGTRGSKRRFNGSGRGRAMVSGKALSGRWAQARPGARRVVVKARVVKIAKAGGGPAAHLKYLQRDGVTQEGARGQLYSAGEDRADGRAFLERGEGDPHQFRFIVAPEDGAELSDLRAFTRDLMTAVERDLGVPLDWVAVDHFNTAHPHSHVVLRGRGRYGAPLFIAGDYIAHGIRERASELVTLELGPESQVEIRRKLEAEVDQDRFTRIDRALNQEARDGQVDLRPDAEPARSSFDRQLRLARIKTLERMGLAGPASAGVWRLKSDLEPTLRRLGERGDIIKAMNQLLADRGVDRPAETLTLHDQAPAAPVVGRVIGKRLADELADRLDIIVDGVDGRVHHLPGGDAATVEAIPTGAIVAVGRAGDARPADKAIASMAREADGIYRPSEHLRQIEAAGRFTGVEPLGQVEAHVRRLEALRRARLVERIDADHWRIPGDFEQRVAGAATGRGPAVTIRVLSALDLEAQIGADGATWLDRQLVGQVRIQPASMNFGGEVERALAARRDRHITNGDADPMPRRGVRYRAGLLAELERRELDQVGAVLAKDHGLPFRRAVDGETVQGVFKATVALASGQYALVERAQDFTLVPWRPVIEPQRGQTVSGVMQGASISWSLGRSRGHGL
jgi:type IV secretory pathway VirD2 relaxase